MLENIEQTFEKYDKDYLKFNYIDNPQSQRPDLCAFILLDRLIPGKSDIVSAAEHDEIYLDVNLEELAQAATEEDILQLVRCGVICSDYGLRMNV